MLTKDRIKKFYEDVERLGLKFPVAEIARKTAESKANVSRILNRGIEPSESFLKRFYESFKIDTISDESNNLNLDNLAEALAIIKQQNEYLQRLIDVSLAELGRELKNGQSRLGAEIRGYGQYPIMKSVDWNQEAFVREMERVGNLIGANLQVSDGRGI